MLGIPLRESAWLTSQGNYSPLETGTGDWGETARKETQHNHLIVARFKYEEKNVFAFNFSHIVSSSYFSCIFYLTHPM